MSGPADPAAGSGSPGGALQPAPRSPGEPPADAAPSRPERASAGGPWWPARHDAVVERWSGLAPRR